MRHRRTYLRSVATAAAALTLAGCSSDGTDGGGDGNDDGSGSDGGDGNDGDAGNDDATPTGTSSPTAAGTTAAESGSGSGSTGRSEYPDYNWDQLDGTSATAATTVEITEFSYDPLVAQVPAGETVTFPNVDSVTHTVTAPGVDVDAVVESGAEGTVSIDEPGTYDYVCRFHAPNMLGRLVVEEG